MNKKWVLTGSLGLIAISTIIVFSGRVFKQKDESKSVMVANEVIEELTIEDKLEDFDVLYSTLKNSFPYFEIIEERVGYNWLDNRKEYEKRIRETKDNLEYFKVLKEIVNEVQNKDTSMITVKEFENLKSMYNDEKSYNNAILNNNGVENRYNYIKEEDFEEYVLPFKVKYIDGKYHLIEDLDKEIKKGFELDSINYLSLNQYEKEYKNLGYLSYDNKNKKPYIYSEYIRCGKGDKFKVSFIDKDKNTYERILEKIDFSHVEKNKDGENLKIERINDGKGTLIKINSMDDDLISRDKETLKKLYKEIKDTETLIFDVRDNKGKSSGYWIENIVEPLISEDISYSNTLLFKGDYIDKYKKEFNLDLVTLDKLDTKEIKDSTAIDDMEKGIRIEKEIKVEESIKYKGKIYILIDKEVENAAEEFITFVKGSNFGTLVGDITEGNGVGIDEALLPLPKSGIIVKFPMDMRINPDGSINEKTHIQPTIYIEETFEDFMSGKDTVMERVH